MGAKEVFQVASAVMLSLGGAGVVLLGLSSFLAKVWAARILEKDRLKYQAELEHLKAQYEAKNQQLQGEIDKTIHVHRLHFESEFRALRHIWRRVVKMRREMASLRPMFSLGPSLSKDEDLARLRTQFTDFATAFDDAVNAFDDNRPFLTEELYTALTAALNTAKAEHIDIRLRGARKDEDPDWFDRGRTNYVALEAHLGTIANLIRTRLRVLAIYPE